MSFGCGDWGMHWQGVRLRCAELVEAVSVVHVVGACLVCLCLSRAQRGCAASLLSLLWCFARVWRVVCVAPYVVAVSRRVSVCISDTRTGPGPGCCVPLRLGARWRPRRLCISAGHAI